MKTYLFKLFISIIFITCSFTGIAQDYSLYKLYVDSLKPTLAAVPNDTNKVEFYFSIAGFYQWSDSDSSLLYSLPGIDLAKKLNFKNGEYDLLHSASQALLTKGNYSKALEFQFRSMDIANQLKDPKKIATTLALIGLVYTNSKDYDKALEFFYKAQKMNVVTLGGPQILNGFIGEAYFDLHNWDSALVYIQRAYELDLKDTAYHWSEPYFYLAALHERKANFAKAIDLYRISFTYNAGNIDVLRSYNGIASVYQKTGATDSAIFYAKQVISLGTGVSIIAPVIEASALLVNIYKSNHDIDSAFKYQEILITSKDSLFNQEKIKQLQNVAFDEQLREQQLSFEKDKYESSVKQYALIAALVAFIIIGFILWRNNTIKQKANALLSQQKQTVETTLTELKSTQQQLIQSEKMASLGELTAGIAHEIQNPLNFVNNFSEVNRELVDEATEEIGKNNYGEVQIILNDIRDNSEKINHHGKRADAIVKGMLQHTQSGKGIKEPTDINALCDEYLKLSYHGLRAKDKNFNADLKTNFDETINKINIVPQDIARVLLNLINNAFYAVNEKQKLLHKEMTSFQKMSSLYEPNISVSTKKMNNNIEIKVSDNGNGIPSTIINKIFQPFFTTKPTGQSTGLGLSLSYDIIKAHGGDIKVETQESEGTTFIIQLPVV